MGSTIRVQNGQIEIDQSIGQPDMVTGERKAAQDMAECLLQEYLPEQDYGSFLKQIIENPVPGAGELFLRHYVAQAIQLLQAKQAVDPTLTPSERIVEIAELITDLDDDGTGIFFVRVETETGEPDVSTSIVVPVQTNHLTDGF